jgi:hypothetical protein
MATPGRSRWRLYETGETTGIGLKEGSTDGVGQAV